MTTSAKSTPPNLSEIDIHKLLSQSQQVALIWGVEDVLQKRPDLTADQAWEVLEECLQLHDCEFAFTCSLIRDVPDFLFHSTDEEGQV